MMMLSRNNNLFLPKKERRDCGSLITHLVDPSVRTCVTFRAFQIFWNFKIKICKKSNDFLIDDDDCCDLHLSFDQSR